LKVLADIRILFVEERLLIAMSQLEGDVQSFYSKELGYQISAPLRGGHLADVSQSHMGHYNERSSNSMTMPVQNGLSRHNRPSGGQTNMGMDSYETGNDNSIEDFATYVNYNAVIDSVPSNDSEEYISRALEHLLTQDMQLWETESQKKSKELVLAKLIDILNTWMARVREANRIPTDVANTNAKLLCYGSYKLGVSSPTGDIDALILAPHFVDRNSDFFGRLYPLLEELAVHNENIKDLTMVNQEHTIMPLIKMTFYNIPIDMVFAKIQTSESIDDFIRNKMDNEEHMMHMDDKMKRSYNGYRNAEMILKSLKNGATESIWLTMKREEIFRTTLKCIKQWAKNNGLDSNKIGYLGGISWALLTAKVCKLYPYKCTSRLLERFFWLFGQEWRWDNSYVRIEKQKPNEILSRGRAMYIMTPSWPQMNSTYNATVSTREIITSRMREAHKVVQGILERNSSGHYITPTDPAAKAQWLELFKKYNFFDSYEHFIEINILGRANSDYLRWLGFVEAKVRILVERLEELLKFYDLKLHPWPNNYDRDRHTFPDYPHATTVYIGLNLHQENDEIVDLNIPVIRFVDMLDTEWMKDNPQRDPAMYNLSVHYRIRSEIPKEVLRAELELPAEAGENEEGSKDGALIKSYVGGTDNEPKELVLSAHKSAMKDDLNQDLPPEMEESKEKTSVGPVSTVLDINSPRKSSRRVEELSHYPHHNNGGIFNPFDEFDHEVKAMSSAMQGSSMLTKRTVASLGQTPATNFSPLKALKIGGPQGNTLNETPSVVGTFFGNEDKFYGGFQGDHGGIFTHGTMNDQKDSAETKAANAEDELSQEDLEYRKHGDKDDRSDSNDLLE